MGPFDVKLFPGGKVIKIDGETTLLSGLLQEGFRIKSQCGGHATCSTCVVRILKGGENLSEIRYSEKKLLGNVFHITKERLSCQTFLKGNVEIDISEHCSGGSKT